MALLALPTELQFQIIQELGAAFFREDVGRLAVCKQWYSIAIALFFADVSLTAKTLLQLFQHPGKEERLERLKPRLRRVEVYLDMFELWDSGLSPAEMVRLRRSPEPQRRSMCVGWISRLDLGLSHLAVLLRHCPQLRAFHFTACPEWGVQRGNYLHGRTLSNLLRSLGRNVVILELDTCGTRMLTERRISQIQQEQPPPPPAHICADIGSLLPQLRRLRLRMCDICPDALCPPEDTPAEHLTDVAVKLSSRFDVPATNSRMTSTRCFWPAPSSVVSGQNLRPEMEEQARLLAAQMRRPQSVRILMQSFTPPQLQVLDVLSENRMVLYHHMRWDEDGEPAGTHRVQYEMRSGPSLTSSRPRVGPVGLSLGPLRGALSSYISNM